MGQNLSGFTPYKAEDVELFYKNNWWRGLTLGELVDRAADIYADRVGFVDQRSRMTFREAAQLSSSLALGLSEMGVTPGERVLLQLPNWNEFVIAYFAIQKAGAIPVLLIDRYRQHEIDHLIKLTGATAWIVPERFGKTAFAPIVDDVVRQNPEMKRVLWVRGKGGEGANSLEELIEKNPLTADKAQKLASLKPDPLNVAHLAPTGGTTGLPKVVPRTHNSLICGVEYASMAWDYTSDDTCLLAGPLGHDLTFTKGFLGGVLTCARLVFLEKPEMESICKAIETERVSAIVWVPTLASRFINFESLGEYDLSSLKKMHSGGAVSQPDLVKRVTALGCTYYNGYGGTEGQTTITRREDPFDKVCSSVGRPTCPYDSYRTIIVDGVDAPEGEAGELVIKGPGVFTGYLDSPNENADAFTESGYFRTGDLAIIDSEGRISLVGRAKEMINRGGESISATEVERLLTSQPGVAAAAAVPMPDPDLGERVCAYVLSEAGSELTFEGIIKMLKEADASVLYLPERIEFVEDFPLTKAGKVDKKVLREDIAKKINSGL